MGQTNNKIWGTWILYMRTVDNKEVKDDGENSQPDTIFITSNIFEQRTWVKNETPYKQTGVMTLKKNKIILTKRTTSTSDQYGPPPDIYYRFKVKGKTLIISNAALTDKKIEDNSIRSHYQKLENK